MTNQIDQQFIQKLNHLVREVLSDEAKFVAKNNQQFANLHSKIFSKTSEISFKGLQESEKLAFRKYFYIGGDTPRMDVPFSNSADEQAFFFDQFKKQVKFCTFNFDRMDFLRPSFSAESDQDPDFSGSQVELITRGVIYPFLHSLEQQQISLLEKKKAGEAASEGEETPENPFQNCADKILVKGVSSQFDTILTYAQLEEIAGQEDLLRKQGIESAQVVQKLREFIQSRWPGIAPELTAEGKVTTYLGSAGISATGISTEVTPGGPAQSFAELLKEMKARQGRKMQYAAIIASKGTLGFTTANFQVISSEGVATVIKGNNLVIDMAGQGNHAVFFLQDRQGVSARISVDTSVYRINGSPDFHFTIYQKPEIDLPSGPKIKLAHPELPRLTTPLLPLYSQMQQPGSFSIASGQPQPVPSAVESAKPPVISGTMPLPGQTPSVPTSPLSQQAFATGKITGPLSPGQIPVGISGATRPPGVLQQPTTVSVVTSSQKTMPKIPPKSTPATTAQPVSGGAAAKPKTVSGQEISSTEKSDQPAYAGGVIPGGRPRSGTPALVKAMVTSALPVAGALATGLAQLLSSSS